MTADERWLRYAIELSRRCPPSRTAFSVGAVIVAADGEPLAEGWSRAAGDPHVHAEEAALSRAADDPRLIGATVYSTLEPCTERASRPVTCTELIVRSGAVRVVMAWREPALFVAGGAGVELLSAAGLEVVVLDALAGPARAVNGHLWVER